MVHIITDTTSVLEPEFARLHDVPVIPQVINFGEESYYEGQQIDIDTFMQRLQTSSELPKTSAPPPELFVEEFEKRVSTGATILCIHPSAEVSGTIRAATVAAQDFPDADIRIVDTRTIATPLGSLVKLAVEMAAAGASADEIETRIRSMIPRCKIYFLIDTLKYLQKGGRIGGAAALLGSVLQIKPILTFRDGKVDQFEKERTQKRAVARLTSLAIDQVNPQDGYLTVMHAGVPQRGLALAEELKATLGIDDVPVYYVPPAIITHGGPGILGVGFFS